MFEFGFERNTLSPQEIIAIAEAEGIPALRVSINSNSYRQSQSFWPKVQEIESNSEKYPVISLGNDSDIVGKLSSNAARSVQFPESSAYMHFLGCISAAMLGRFTVEYHGTQQPTALYVVTSQPPSTGKSAINSLALAPMISEVDRINENRKRERKKVMAKLSQIAKEMKLEKSPSEMAALFEDKEDSEEKLERLGDLTFPVSDTTPEGLARINNRQGNFAVISDEATSINSLLGMTYGSGDKKTNSELVLKAWDAGHVSIARANVDNNMTFVAMGVISVIAQDETLRAIMEAGARGIGVSERFLLVREESFLGRRKFVDENGNSTYEPIDSGLKADYFKLVHEIMNEVNVELRVTATAMKYLNMARQDMEPKLSDGGEYSHTMLRGAMGKFDKQAIRIASVLHVIRNWFNPSGGNPGKSRDIELETMQEAVLMFHELSKTYLSSASAAGHAGDTAEMTKLVEILVKQAKSGTPKGLINVRSLYENARRVKPFDGQAGVMTRIRDHLLPMLEDKGYVCLIGDKVYVNPQLLG
ncbi:MULTISPECIES: DUF3987 domain-containing protein [Gammaproteobacteria]|uniref:DUF3987 domain-containing protein n=1 Tax=Gammaproteobacteria TaxID=1236 RepID=UPI002FC5A366